MFSRLIGLLLCLVNPADAQETCTLQSVAESYATVVANVKTWKGRVDMNITAEAKTSKYSGEFVWQSSPFIGYSRLETSGVVHVKIPGKDDFKSKDVKFVRESIVADKQRTCVWLGLPMKHVPGFEWSERKRQSSFFLVERRMAEDATLVQPNDEFLPEFMFRGNVPYAIPKLLEFFQGENDVKTETSNLAEVFRILIADSAFEFNKLHGYWVPKNLKNDAGSITWDWDTINGQLIPNSLVVEEASTHRRGVYKVTESEVNFKTDPNRFEVENFALRNGDRLADHLSNELFEYKDGKFIPFVLQEKATFPFRIMGVSIVSACILGIAWKILKTKR